MTWPLATVWIVAYLCFTAIVLVALSRRKKRTSSAVVQFTVIGPDPQENRRVARELIRAVRKIRERAEA